MILWSKRPVCQQYPIIREKKMKIQDVLKLLLYRQSIFRQIQQTIDLIKSEALIVFSFNIHGFEKNVFIQSRMMKHVMLTVKLTFEVSLLNAYLGVFYPIIFFCVSMKLAQLFWKIAPRPATPPPSQEMHKNKVYIKTFLSYTYIIDSNFKLY